MEKKPATLEKDLRGQRFRTVLNNYMAERGLSATDLASVLKVNYVTVYNWMRGPHMPNRARLQIMCKRLDWDYDGLFNAEVTSQMVFARAFLSFDMLNIQFRRIRAVNPLEALSLVALGATVLFNRVVAEGLLADLKITRTVNCRLTLLHPSLAGMSLQVGPGDQDILVEVLDDLGVPIPGSQWALNDAGMDILLHKLKSFDERLRSAESLEHGERKAGRAKSRTTAGGGDAVPADGAAAEPDGDGESRDGEFTVTADATPSDEPAPRIDPRDYPDKDDLRGWFLNGRPHPGTVPGNGATTVQSGGGAAGLPAGDAGGGCINWGKLDQPGQPGFPV